MGRVKITADLDGCGLNIPDRAVTYDLGTEIYIFVELGLGILKLGARDVTADVSVVHGGLEC